MSSIAAGTTTTTALVSTADTTGSLVLKTGASATTALTLDTSQNATFAGNVVGVLKSGTAVTASGTSVSFTGIPSTAKRITVMFSGVSTNGTSIIQIQVGSGSVTTSGYFCNYANINSGTGQGNLTSGISINGGTIAASIQTGHIIFTLISSNTWIASGNVLYTNNAGAMSMIAGSTPNLSGALDRVRITTVNGTDTFDAGTINIMWE